MEIEILSEEFKALLEKWEIGGVKIVVEEKGK
jgi:hypothetical protein